jgi:hypothetical protein
MDGEPDSEPDYETESNSVLSAEDDGGQGEEVEAAREETAKTLQVQTQDKSEPQPRRSGRLAAEHRKLSPSKSQALKESISKLFADISDDETPLPPLPEMIGASDFNDSESLDVETNTHDLQDIDIQDMEFADKGA